MRYVPAPVQFPQRCAFLPTIAGFAPGGFIEGEDMDPRGGGVRAYMSMVAFKQIAEQMGYQPPGGRQVNDTKVARLERELAEKDELILALQQQLDAVEVLRNNGFAQGRKPGRKVAV